MNQWWIQEFGQGWGKGGGGDPTCIINEGRGEKSRVELGVCNYAHIQ